ncbi:hypothetical protein STEG23_037289 [Scotinomys teguina]
MTGKRRRRNTSCSTRAGLQFSVSRVARCLREGNYSKHLSSNAPVFLASVLEYLTSHILELSGKEAHLNGKKRISPRHVYQVVQHNEHLHQLFEENSRSVEDEIPESNED